MKAGTISALPGKITHAAKIELLAIRDILSNGWPDVMLQFGGGIGDELLLTVVAHELKRRQPRLKIWQVSHSAELLHYNPDYHKVFKKDHWPLRYALFLEKRRLRLAYATEVVPRKKEIPPTGHILAELCRRAGITGNISLRPYFYFANGERENGRLAARQISIQCCDEGAYATVMRNKLWYCDRFQEVVNRLKADQGDSLEVVQVGGNQDPPLTGVIDRRGKTTLRQTAAILANSECFIGTVGFLMHLARAVECRSVILYGGREHSAQTGYVCNENLDSFVGCAPCWLWDDCYQGRKCMDMIGAHEVCMAVERALEKHGTPFEAEVVKL